MLPDIDSDDEAAKDHEPKFPDIEICVQLDPIVEAEAKRGPVFRRELFDAAYAAYPLVLQTSPEEQQNHVGVSLRNIYGTEGNVPVLPIYFGSGHNAQTHVWKRVWYYRSIQSLGEVYGRADLEQLYSYNFSLQHQEIAKDCLEPNVDEMAKLWTEQWKASQMYRRLTGFLEEHAGKSMQRVDKIICFGLGCISKGRVRSYIQHLAACTIRDIIARQQHNSEAPRILAQDPDYCGRAKAYLATHFDMYFMDDPEGFKIVNGNTFVLSFAPNVPVRQIVQGLTHEAGGPAGMFCDCIEDDGLDCNGRKYNMKDFVPLAPYSTCPSSPGLWKFKHESVWMEYGDRKGKDWFGSAGIYLKKPN